MHYMALPCYLRPYDTEGHILLVFFYVSTRGVLHFPVEADINH